MEDKVIWIKNEEAEIHSPNHCSKLGTEYSYFCPFCPFPIEILKIDDKENTLIFKCLNTKEKEEEKTIQINEYLDLIKKYAYLDSKCSLCNKKQNEIKNEPIFSYCIKCDAIICSDCINKHLKINEKNHYGLNTEYIIKNNEKNIKCLLHPKEKNVAFCLKCKIHLCKECVKSQKHINHTKNNILEVSVTDEIKKTLNGILMTFERRKIQFNEEKEKMEKNYLMKKKLAKKKQKNKKKNKLKELKKEFKRELLENEKFLNDKLTKLKLKYEN